jgi:hypothetical protein
MKKKTTPGKKKTTPGKKKTAQKKAVKKTPIKKSKVIKPKRMDLTENLDPFTDKEKEILENNIILKEKKVKEDARKIAEKRLNKIKADKEKTYKSNYIELEIKETNQIQKILISEFDLKEDKKSTNRLDINLIKIGICFSTDQAMKLCANFGYHQYYIKTEVINHYKYSKKFHVYKLIKNK